MWHVFFSFSFFFLGGGAGVVFGVFFFFFKLFFFQRVLSCFLELLWCLFLCLLLRRLKCFF